MGEQELSGIGAPLFDLTPVAHRCSITKKKEQKVEIGFIGV